MLHRLAMVSIFFCPLPAAAEGAATILLEKSDDPMTQSYFAGIATALTMANAHIEFTGNGPLMYCIPKDMVFTGELALEAMRFSYAKSGEGNPALLVIVGMRQMFPCN